MAEVKWAVQNGEVDKLKELDFDVNQLEAGRTLLHVAADYGQDEVIQYLVEAKKADVNAKDKYGISVLLTAIFESEGQARYLRCIKYLLSQNADKTGTGPDGKTYIECTEDETIKQLLK